MSALSELKMLASIAFKPSILTGHSNYLFVLSHMRSRSSVLSHILGSNEGVCGYSELQISYRKPTDFFRMKAKLYSDLKADLADKYLLDKLLHNELSISKEVLNAKNTKIIMLLREPESTFKSTIHMGRTAGMEWHKDPEKVLEYYCSRLEQLEEYAQLARGNYFFLESDDLVNNTNCVLSRMTEWLGLASPLESRYSKFNNTAKPGHGDPSSNIGRGILVKTKPRPTKMRFQTMKNALKHFLM